MGRELLPRYNLWLLPLVVLSDTTQFSFVLFLIVLQVSVSASKSVLQPDKSILHLTYAAQIPPPLLIVPVIQE